LSIKYLADTYQPRRAEDEKFDWPVLAPPDKYL